VRARWATTRAAAAQQRPFKISVIRADLTAYAFAIFLANPIREVMDAEQVRQQVGSGADR